MTPLSPLRDALYLLSEQGEGAAATDPSRDDLHALPYTLRTDRPGTRRAR